jgi:hypothetical protein
MDKIVVLLKKLDNNVTPNIAKRLDGLKNLENRYSVAKSELEANPDDEELQEAMQEITDYLEDYREDLIEDLEDLLEEKTKSESKPKVEEVPKGEETPKGEENPKVDEEKKSTNVAGFILWGILFVASAGAINYVRKNR